MNLTRLQPFPVLLVATVAFLFTPLVTQAQDEAGKLYLGVRGGIGQATLEGDAIGSSDSRSTAGGGVFVTYNLNEAFSMQLEGLYSQKGGEDVTADGGPNESDALNLSDASVSVNYLEFPLLFKLTAPISVVKLRALAGPSLSFQTGASINGSEQFDALQSSPPVSDRFQFYDINGVIGGEIGIPIPNVPGEVALDGRYNAGLVDVDVNQGFDVNNQKFSGSLSVRIEF